MPSYSESVECYTASPAVLATLHWLPNSLLTCSGPQTVRQRYRSSATQGQSMLIQYLFLIDRQYANNHCATSKETGTYFRFSDTLPIFPMPSFLIELNWTLKKKVSQTFACKLKGWCQSSEEMFSHTSLSECGGRENTEVFHLSEVAVWRNVKQD